MLLNFVESGNQYKLSLRSGDSCEMIGQHLQKKDKSKFRSNGEDIFSNQDEIFGWIQISDKCIVISESNRFLL